MALDQSKLKNLDHDMDVVNLGESKFDDAPAKYKRDIRDTSDTSSQSQSSGSGNYFVKPNVRERTQLEPFVLNLGDQYITIPQNQPKATQPTNPSTDNTPPNKGEGDTGDPSTRLTNTQTLPDPAFEPPDKCKDCEQEANPEIPCTVENQLIGLCPSPINVQKRTKVTQNATPKSAKIHTKYNSQIRRQQKIPQKQRNVYFKRRSQHREPAYYYWFGS